MSQTIVCSTHIKSNLYRAVFQHFSHIFVYPLQMLSYCYGHVYYKEHTSSLCLSTEADALVFISGDVSCRFDTRISLGGMHLVFERCCSSSSAHVGSGDPAGAAPGAGQRLWSHARRSFCELLRYDINEDHVTSQAFHTCASCILWCYYIFRHSYK